MRIAIIGAPRAGKTTLALELGGIMAVDQGRSVDVLHTDDWIGLGWSRVSDKVARELVTYNDEEDLIVEGVAVVRALRKALELRADEAPVDRCIVLERPRVALTAGQRAMARGCATILRAIEPELVRRGVAMERPA